MAFWRSASGRESAPLAPTVILTRGDQVLRKEYPARKLAIGTRAEADLQFQAAGLPDHHLFLKISRNGVAAYVTGDMDGVFTRAGHAIALGDLIALGVLPSKDGVYTLTLSEGMDLTLDFGDHRLQVGFAPKPAYVPLPPRRPRAPEPAMRGRLVINPNFRFAEIPAIEDEQPVFLGGLFGVGLLYALILLGLVWAIKFLPPKIVLYPLSTGASSAHPFNPAIPGVEDLPVTATKPSAPVLPPTPQEVAKAKTKEVIEPITSTSTKALRDITEALKMLETTMTIVRPPTAAPGDYERTIREIGEATGPVGMGDVLKKMTTVEPGKKFAAPTVAVVDPAVTGETTRDKDRSFAAISVTMRGKMGLFKSFYNKLLRSYPGARGKIAISFTILADGSVTHAAIVRSDFGKYPDFERGVLKRVESIKFEAIPDSVGSIGVEFPFVFNG